MRYALEDDFHRERTQIYPTLMEEVGQLKWEL